MLDDVADLGEEEDGAGCPLPSTPEDEMMLDTEVYTLDPSCSKCKMTGNTLVQDIANFPKEVISFYLFILMCVL